MHTHQTPYVDDPGMPFRPLNTLCDRENWRQKKMPQPKNLSDEKIIKESTAMSISGGFQILSRGVLWAAHGHLW